VLWRPLRLASTRTVAGWPQTWHCFLAMLMLLL